jgi:nitroreductase
MIAYEARISEIIKSRHSCRTYLDQELPSELFDAVQKECEALREGVFKESVCFSFLDTKAAKTGALGDYGGFVKNYRYFVAGTIEKTDFSCESYGYLLEQLVLKVTELGLQSCWFGYFNNQYFSSLLKSGERLTPAIALVGLGASKATLKDRVARLYAKARTRKPWEELFFQENLTVPLSKSKVGLYEEPLEMVRLAPSAGNLQPWRIIREGNESMFHFYMKRIKKDYDRRHLHNVDIGIAMSHFELSLKEKNIGGVWKRLTPPNIQMPADTDYRVSWIGT